MRPSIFRLICDNGLLVIDTGCFKHLLAPKSRERFEANTKVAGWTPWPSTLNAMELICHPNPGYRTDLLQVVHELTAGRPLLPWPTKLLRLAGEAISESTPKFTVTPTELDELVANPNSITKEHTSHFAQILEDFKVKFENFHTYARGRIRQQLVRQGAITAWTTPQVFLDDFWMTSEVAGGLADHFWAACGFPEPVPRERLLKDPVWRMLFEMEGISLYDRTVCGQRPRTTQYTDVAQLMYLGLSTRRMLVTQDNGLFRSAQAVLRGRYPRTRVCRIEDLTA